MVRPDLRRHRARGVSLRSIAADLNAQQVPTVTGTQWTPQRVRDIALMATYAGKRVHNPGAKNGNARRHSLGTVTQGTWAALVSLEQYYAVRRLLTDPQRRTSRPGRAKHLLSMIATCGVCGGVLAVRYSRDAGEYTCRAGGHVRARQEELDEIRAEPDRSPVGRSRGSTTSWSAEPTTSGYRPRGTWSPRFRPTTKQ